MSENRMNSEKQSILNVLDHCVDVVIAGHTNPDGDAVGSCLALAIGLAGLGKNPYVLLEDYNIKFNVIPGQAYIYKGDIENLSFDAFISLDCGSAERLGKAQMLLEKAPVTVCIDHHLSTENFARYNYINSESSSTSQLVYEIMDGYCTMNQEIASALYAGIIFDTGGFRHGSTSPETHRIVAKLIDKKIPFSHIYSEIMYKHSIEEAKIFSKALQNLQISKKFPFAYSYVTVEDLKDAGAKGQDLDGIVEYILNIRGVELSVFIYGKGANESKTSLRSTCVNVGHIAQAFNGGGHKLAAGFTFYGSVADALDKILPVIEKELMENG